MAIKSVRIVNTHFIAVAASVSLIFLGCKKTKDSNEQPPGQQQSPPASPDPSTIPKQLIFNEKGSTAEQLPWGRCFVSGSGLQPTFECTMDGYGYAHELVVGSVTRKVAASGQPSGLPVDLMAAFGRTKVCDSDGCPRRELSIETNVTLGLTFDNGTAVRGQLGSRTVSVPTILTELTAKATAGFTFGPSEKPIERHSILILAEFSRLGVVGPAATFDQTDWIAIGEPKMRATNKKCKVTVDEKPIEVELEAEELTVVVRQRNTGQELQRKTFLASSNCPDFGVTKGVSVVATVDGDAIVGWLRSLLRT